MLQNLLNLQVEHKSVPKKFKKKHLVSIKHKIKKNQFKFCNEIL
jgi:hypothetical protein